MSSPEKRRERVAQAIRLTYASLDSHLDYSTAKVDEMCESCGNRKFHSTCVKEYAFVIHVLADLI